MWCGEGLSSGDIAGSNGMHPAAAVSAHLLVCFLLTLRPFPSPSAAPPQEEFDFEEALKKFNKVALEQEAGEEHVSAPPAD